MQLVVLKSKRFKPKRSPGFYLILTYKNLENQKDNFEIWFDENCSIAKRSISILYAALYTTPDTQAKVEYQYQGRLYDSNIPECEACKLRRQAKPNSAPCGLRLDPEEVRIKQLRSITIKYFDSEPFAVRLLWTPADIQEVCNLIELERLRLRSYHFNRRLSKYHSYVSDPIEFSLSADMPHQELEQYYIDKTKLGNL